MKNINTKVVIVGSGPSGYSASFRLADLGIENVVVEKKSNLGGVCLNVGCIPSKFLLHVSKFLREFKEIKKKEIISGSIKINIEEIRKEKNKIIQNISNNLKKMASIRNVQIVHGYARFLNKNSIIVRNEEEKEVKINFENAIIAVGSKPRKMSIIKNLRSERIWYSDEALSLKFIPKNMLIIGGGIIGLEIGTIYSSLGTQVEIVEISEQIVPNADMDIIEQYIKQTKNIFSIKNKVKIISILENEKGILVKIQYKNRILENQYEAILICIGRKPNCDFKKMHLQDIGILRKKEFIQTNAQTMQTNISNIYAIGDVSNQPMLAHKGSNQGKIVAEIISGKKYYFDPKTIPFIAYTDPEIAWIGFTEKEAKLKNINYRSAKFSWKASGRAIVSGYDGVTKLIFERNTKKIIGGAIVGQNAGELLGEIGIAIENSVTSEDIALSIHAHPTMYESIGITAEIYEGIATDVLNRSI
ncbi:dihydrolipoyl dehydrogenase [bacterium endosymbiont of Pedicinus badii]|uniref:dihydrolipoyl dehydrogenase n=1 Tax=bacterium endosymbiont of Pedicinus badii TaxID=1719126 RepID=UPI0009BADD5D|nr:dihydrolipoyl dehydrogenase [bacterium endosymbiont of Pedicinus badii]OQM34231.1 dihydrolipoamide dehydrogenase [bacterium endosymbiont of Pedicinus badii]